jgi:hypothetical protein
MSERTTRFRQGVDLVGVGYALAILGGAGAGAVTGIGAAGLMVGSMAKGRWLRGIDVAIGLAIFSGVGASIGAIYGAFSGLLVGLVVAPVLAVWLLRPAARALSPARRTSDARVVAFVTTFAITAVPVLFGWLVHGDGGFVAAFGIPTLAALAWAPYAGGRVARRFDVHHAAH